MCTALHEIPAGEMWPVEAIRARQEMVRAAGLEWTVVESLDVTERTKMRAPGWQQDVENFVQSIRHLAGLWHSDDRLQLDAAVQLDEDAPA